MLWIWFCAAIVAALTVLIFKRMPIEFIYAASAKHKKQAFKIKIYNVDLIRDRKKGKDNKKKSKDKSDDKQKNDEFSFSQFMQWLKWVKDVYEEIKDGIGDVLLYLGKKAQCRNFTVHLDLGFKSAADTGIAAGAAYASVYSVASLVYYHLDIKKEELDIEVNPRFDKQCADLYIKSIFYLSPAHIIKVVLKLLKLNKKIRKIIKQ